MKLLSAVVFMLTKDVWSVCAAKYPLVCKNINTAFVILLCLLLFCFISKVGQLPNCFIPTSKLCQESDL